MEQPPAEPNPYGTSLVARGTHADGRRGDGDCDGDGDDGDDDVPKGMRVAHGVPSERLTC